MRWVTKAVFEGPSPYAETPVVVVDVAGTPEAWETLGRGLMQMQERWSQRTETGPTPVTSALGVAQWARGLLNAVRGDVVDAGAESHGESKVRFWLGYHVASLSLEALKLSLETALRCGRSALTDAGLQDIEAQISALGRKTRTFHPDYQITYIMRAARALGLPVQTVVRVARVWQVGWGECQQTFFETATHQDSFVGGYLAKNKVWTKALLASVGAPVVKHVMVRLEQDLASAAEAIGWPCVVKPLDRGGGKGVSANVQSVPALKAAFADARQYTAGPVMVEQHIAGDDHRLVVVGGRLVAAVRREPSCVLGDGQSTVPSLVDAFNARRRQAQPNNQRLVPVVEDAAFQRHLQGQGLSLLAVPPAGSRVTLRSVSNLSMGGQKTCVTEAIHPTVRAMAESVAAVSGLHTVGLDYMTTDISADWQTVPGAFVEINTMPGLDVVDDQIARSPDWLASVLFNPSVGRVPVVCVVVANADWPTLKTQLQAWLAAPNWGGSAPGWVWANGMAWQTPQHSAHQAAQALWRHKTVQRAVVVQTREDLATKGFVLDRANRLVVVGEALPPEWQRVANQVASSVVACINAQALVQGLTKYLGLDATASTD